MIKTFILLSILFFSCSSTKSQATSSKSEFDNVLKYEKLTDNEKLVEFQIQLSKHEDEIYNINEKSNKLRFSFDSLKSTNDSVIFLLEQQIDSFRVEQSLLIGPEFSNNIIKLYNKVNILEDRAFLWIVSILSLLLIWF